MEGRCAPHTLTRTCVLVQVGELNELLDRLAAASRDEGKAAAVRDLMRRTTPEQVGGGWCLCLRAGWSPIDSGSMCPPLPSPPPPTDGLDRAHHPEACQGQWAGEARGPPRLRRSSWRRTPGPHPAAPLFPGPVARRTTPLHPPPPPKKKQINASEGTIFRAWHRQAEACYNNSGMDLRHVSTAVGASSQLAPSWNTTAATHIRQWQSAKMLQEPTDRRSEASGLCGTGLRLSAPLSLLAS